jgi:hypothetical protein
MEQQKWIETNQEYIEGLFEAWVNEMQDSLEHRAFCLNSDKVWWEFASDVYEDFMQT